MPTLKALEMFHRYLTPPFSLYGSNVGLWVLGCYPKVYILPFCAQTCPLLVGKTDVSRIEEVGYSIADDAVISCGAFIVAFFVTATTAIVSLVNVCMFSGGRHIFLKDEVPRIPRDASPLPRALCDASSLPGVCPSIVARL